MRSGRVMSLQENPPRFHPGSSSHDVGAELGAAKGVSDDDGIALGVPMGNDDGAKLGCLEG